jgi:hypothetical protein
VTYALPVIAVRPPKILLLTPYPKNSRQTFLAPLSAPPGGKSAGTHRRCFAGGPPVKIIPAFNLRYILYFYAHTAHNRPVRASPLKRLGHPRRLGRSACGLALTPPLRHILPPPLLCCAKALLGAAKRRIPPRYTKCAQIF